MDWIVVDDFCEDVDLVKRSAFAGGFGKWAPNKGEVGSSNYDGMAFYGHHAPMLKAVVAATRSVVVPNNMFFRITNEDTEQAYIHSDREYGAHTCVAYLSEHDEPYGTAFYRHKPTGLTRMPTFQEMKEQGTFEMFKEDMESRNPDNWEQVGYVEGKYNRAVIFEAPLFHSRFPINGIGNDDRSGRLVWVTHFFKLNGYGELH